MVTLNNATVKDINSKLDKDNINDDFKNGNHPILKIKNLVMVYENRFRAINNLNLDLYSGQLFALLGHNGAGKTTLI